MGYLINKTGYNHDTIRVGVDDEVVRITTDGGTIEGYQRAADTIFDVISKSLYDSASTAMFPVASKQAVLYSHKPTDGTKDFAFTRAASDTTRLNESGILELVTSANIPRINFLGNLEKSHLLLEEERTNLSIHSENFSNAAWTKTSCTVVADAALSPLQTTNCQKVIADNGTTDFKIETTSAVTVTATDNINISVFAKYDGGFQNIVLGFTNDEHRYAFNIRKGTKIGSVGAQTVADSEAKIEDYGNGWYRCSMRGDAASTSTKMEIMLSDDGTNVTATGDGSKGVLLWGTQMEKGDGDVRYSSSYIRTSSASVTRAEDLAQKANYIDADSNFTLMFEVEPHQLVSSSHRFFNGSGDFGFLDVNADNTLRYRFNSTNYTFTLPSSGSFKIAFVRGTDYKIYYNGALAHTISTLPTGTQNLFLRGGKMNAVALWTSALTDAQSKSITA